MKCSLPTTKLRTTYITHRMHADVLDAVIPFMGKFSSLQFMFIGGLIKYEKAERYRCEVNGDGVREDTPVYIYQPTSGRVCRVLIGVAVGESTADPMVVYISGFYAGLLTRTLLAIY